jgi:hypothetical protein
MPNALSCGCVSNSSRSQTDYFVEWEEWRKGPAPASRENRFKVSYDDINGFLELVHVRWSRAGDKIEVRVDLQHFMAPSRGLPFYDIAFSL